MNTEIDVFGNIINKVTSVFKKEEKPLEVKADKVEVLEFEEEDLAKPLVEEEVVTEEETAEAIEEIMEEFPPLDQEEVVQHPQNKKSNKKRK